MPVDARIARTVRAAGAHAGVRLDPTSSIWNGVQFKNDLGEVEVIPVNQLGQVILRIICYPTASRKETWRVDFTLFAPGAHECLLAALRTICWKPLLDADKKVP